MKRSQIKLFLCVLLLLGAVRYKAQQVVINIDTVMHYGTTDTLDYMPVIINANGNVVVAGNQKVSATQYDALMAEQTTNAVSVWVNTFNASGNKAFITSSVNDVSGNIYSAGAIRTTTSNGVDYMVVKRNSSGALIWTYYYDGLGNGNDVATSICIDPSGNLYVTGVSEGVFPALADYATIKLDKSTGAQLWVSRYNYANSFDVATKVVWAGTNNIVVTGSSGNSFTDYSIASIRYNATTGSTVGIDRAASAGIGEDKPFGLVSDTIGNLYYVGAVHNGANYDALLTKLDTSLAVVWTKTLNLNGFDDAAVGVAIDDSMHVIITGTSYYSATNKELFVAKYTANGTQKWLKKKRVNDYAMGDAEAVRIVLKNDNEIFIGASFTTNGNQDLALLRYDRHGTQTMEKTYNGPANGKDQFMDMVIENNKVIVSARSFNGTDDDNIVINFSYRDIDMVATSGFSGNDIVKGEVIVRFDKSALKLSKIDNREVEFGRLSDFVADSTCNKIGIALDPKRELDLNAKNIQVRKMELLLTSKDTLSLSRMGDYVPVPAVYASLILTLPPTLNVEVAANNLHTLKPDIAFAQTNQLFTFFWVPNDSYYAADQTSLHPSVTYPNAHINCEPAWDYTKGQPWVKVGVYDSGIYPYGVSDFNNAIDATYNFLGAGASAIDYQGHGTRVASVIGARSNDGNGITGVAGGNNGTGGAKIVAMKINDYSNFTPSSMIKTAFMKGATGTNVAGGLGLQIMNCSWGKLDSIMNYELMEGVDFVNQNGVAFVAARGNAGGTYTHAVNAPSQPATLSSQKVMNVGASGNDGEYHKQGANGTGFTSMHSHNVDFLAPGAGENVFSIKGYEANPVIPSPAAHTYTTFNGTSAAAPHVSGVVALMMSYRNQPTPNWDNIVHEDCEAILKRTATDLTNPTYTQSFGPDFVSGYGRINADSALSALEPQYKIRHIDLTHYSSSASTSTAVIASNVSRYWSGSAAFAAGNYSVDIIEYTVTYNYNFSSEIFLDAWALHKASNGHPNASSTAIFNENYYSEVVSASNTSATLKTWGYRFNYQASPPYNNLGGMMNPTPANLKAAFSLYTLGNPLTSVKEQEAGVGYFNVYPNPSNGNFTVGFSSKKDTKGLLKVMDISGRIVHEQQTQVKNGLNRYDLTLSSLPRGIYFVNLGIESNPDLIKKILIN